MVNARDYSEQQRKKRYLLLWLSDKKIKKYLEENKESKENSTTMPSVNAVSPHGSNAVPGNLPYPFWQPPVEAWQGYPFFGPMSMRLPKQKPYTGGACYYCKRPGHVIARCPKLKEKDK